MLAYIAIILAVVFIVLERTGMLESFFARLSQGPPENRRDRSVKQIPYDPEADKRLDVFAQFIDQLANDKEEEE